MLDSKQARGESEVPRIQCRAFGRKAIDRDRGITYTGGSPIRLHADNFTQEEPR